MFAFGTLRPANEQEGASTRHLADRSENQGPIQFSERRFQQIIGLSPWSQTPFFAPQSAAANEPTGGAGEKA